MFGFVNWRLNRMIFYNGFLEFGAPCSGDGNRPDTITNRSPVTHPKSPQTDIGSGSRSGELLYSKASSIGSSYFIYVFEYIEDFSFKAGDKNIIFSQKIKFPFKIGVNRLLAHAHDVPSDILHSFSLFSSDPRQA
jgi:hypothetical protein